MTFERPINDEGEEKYTKIATYFLIDIFQIDILKVRDYEYKIMGIIRIHRTGIIIPLTDPF